MAGQYLPEDDQTSAVGAPAPATTGAVGMHLPGEGPQNDAQNANQDQSWWGGVTNAIGKDWGAAYDTIGAALLQDEGSERSRYALRRAQHTVQTAQKAEEGLSTGQKIAVMGLGRMAPAMAATATAPVTGAVGPAIGASLFATQVGADVLESQAAQGDRYNLQTAAAAGLGAAGVDALTGGMLGQTVGKGLIRNAVGTTARRATEAGTSGGLQGIISNVASGRDWNENLLTNVAAGMAIGGGMHVGLGAAKKLGPANYGNRPTAPRPNTMEDVAGPQAEPFVRPSETEAENITGNDQTVTPQDMAQGEYIPAGERIPGSDFDPNMYGPERRGAGGGMGFGPDRPAGEAAAGKLSHAVGKMKGLYDAFRENGMEGVLSPAGVKMAKEADLTAEKQGLNTHSDFVEGIKDTEKNVDILKQHLSTLEPGTPEYQDALGAISNITKMNGSAAARGRTNLLATKADMLTTPVFHNAELTPGMYDHSGPKYNLAEEVHGLHRTEIQEAHEAFKTSEPSSSFLGGYRKGQLQNDLTYESAFNAMKTGYQKGRDTAFDSFNHNHGVALEVKNQLNKTAQPELWKRANQLTEDLEAYKTLATGVDKGKGLNLDKLDALHDRITDNAIQLGVQNKLKNVAGESGSFDPILDMEGWKGFHDSTQRMDRSITRGQFKEENVVETGNDVSKLIKKVPGAKAAVEATVGLTTQAMAKQTLAKAQKRGAVMSQAHVVPERAEISHENVEAALKAGNIEAAAKNADEALKSQNINTGEPEVGPTTSSAGHTAQDVGDELIRHAQSRAQAQAEAEGRANAERVAAEAAQPRQMEQPTVEPTEPVTEAPAAPEAAPAEPEKFAINPKRKGESRREARERQRREALEAQKAAMEEAVQPTETAPAEEAPKAQPEKMVPKKKAAPAPEPVVEAAKATPEKLAAQPKPSEKVEAAKAPKESEEVKEPTKEEAVKAEEKAEIDKPVETEALNKREGESKAQHTQRLASMAKKLIKKEETKLKETLPAKRTLADKARVEGLHTGYEHLKQKVTDYADSNGYEVADVWATLMEHPEGLEHVFKEGYGKDAIAGRLNKTMSKAINDAKAVARGSVDEAGQIIRRVFREHDISATLEGKRDQFVSDLKLKGVHEDAIHEAIKNAQAEASGRYASNEQIKKHLRAVLRGRAQEATTRPTKVETHLPISTSKAALTKAVKALGIEGNSALSKKINNIVRDATWEGTGNNGVRKALTADQEASVMAKIQKAIEREEEVQLRASKSDKADDKLKAKAKAAAEEATAAKKALEKAHSELAASQAENQKLLKEKVEQYEKERQSNESEAKEHSDQIDQVEKSFKEMNNKETQSETAAREELRNKLENLKPDELEMAGHLAMSEIPDVTSIHDPSFRSWKMKVDVAVEGLNQAGRTHEARVLSTLANTIETGLKRKEQLPGEEHKDLILSDSEYQAISGVLGEGEGGELNIMKAAAPYYGKFGQTVRRILLGSSKTSMRQKFHLPTSELKRLREAALNNGGPDGDLPLGGIKAKPKK